MVREIIKLSPEQGREIVHGDSDEFDIIEETIDSISRWSSNHTVVVKRISDGKYFTTGYSQGLTESQDESPFEHSGAEFHEVFAKEKTIIIYE